MTGQNEQMGFNLTTFVAPVFNSQPIKDMCILIDTKVEQGKKYNDLKEQLLTWIGNSVDLSCPAPGFNEYRQAYEFVKEY